MIDNYDVDKNGVIYQIERSPFSYDQNYVGNSYDSYGISNDLMSHLRLGYVLGSIGKAPKTLLDVGYGNGSFLKLAKSVVQTCFGADIPPAYPLPEGIEFVDNLYNRHYEVVTFFDSLEHFQDIYEIQNLNCDYVVLSMPNCHYVGDEWFRTWKHRKPNEHLWHFNDKSLIKFMDSIDFECVNICNVEDTIRKPVDDLSNILSGVFKRKSL